jgi:hypothetical protein
MSAAPMRRPACGAAASCLPACATAPRAAASRASAAVCASAVKGFARCASLRRPRPAAPLAAPGARAPRRRFSPARALDDDDVNRSLPQPEVKSFTRKALRRIDRDGPREADIRDEAGRIVKEVLPRAFAACLPRVLRCKRL